MRLVDAFRIMASHPHVSNELFQGKFSHGSELPWRYIPTWIVISTPPVALLLGVIGTGAVFYRSIIRPTNTLRNTDLRFWFLLVACLALPVVTVVVLGSNLYNDWRQMYFLYVPLCLLGVFGLHWLVSTLKWASLRAGVYVLAGAGLVAGVVEMASIHPHQAVYFNFLVDRRTPGRLCSQYKMGYLGTSQRGTLEYLLERFPSMRIYMNTNYKWVGNSMILSKEEDRQRIYMYARPGTLEERRIFPPYNWRSPFADDEYTHFNPVISCSELQQPRFPPVLYMLKIYNSAISAVTTSNLSLVDEATADRYRAEYRSVVSGKPVARSNFGLYLNGNTLSYVKQSCSPKDMHGRFSLHVFSADTDDLADDRKERGFNMNFDFVIYGVRFDGRCLIEWELPEHDITRIRTGQWIPGGPVLWQVEFPFPE